jgi:PAS domain S-box-containing protein
MCPPQALEEDAATMWMQLEQDCQTRSGNSSCIRTANSLGIPAAETPMPERIGRYQISSEIARGGMGVVFKAWDPSLDRFVAIKVLHQHLMADSDLKARFFNEARINGQLEHPSIVSVHEVGQCEDDRPFFAMRLLEGDTLANLLASRADSQSQQMMFLRLFEKICDGVAFAHSHGVIHRDLKPANVIVGEFGMVKIMDWGLAKTLHPEMLPTTNALTSAAQPTGSNGVSAEDSMWGLVIGTPAYLAPEQARGDSAHMDERVDVFGLGAILCHILTGSCPYPSPKPSRLEQAISANLAPAFARLDSCQAEPAVVALAKQCLAKDPEDRPCNGNEVASTLRSYLESDLRRAERDLVRFFELSLDLFCIAGLDGYFRRINGNFSRLLGYSDSEILSRPFADFIHPDDLAPTAQAMSALSLGLPVVQFTNRYLHAKGHYLYLEWAAKIEAEAGNNIYAVARDVSNRHQVSKPPRV